MPTQTHNPPHVPPQTHGENRAENTPSFGEKRKIPDITGNYDIDGVTQDTDFRVIVASDEERLLPVKSFAELYQKMKRAFKRTHH